MSRLCAKCNNTKPASYYSTSQWRKRAGLSKCLICTKKATRYVPGLVEVRTSAAKSNNPPVFVRINNDGITVTEYFSIVENGQRMSVLNASGKAAQRQDFSSPSDFLRKRERLSRRAKMYYTCVPYRGMAISGLSYIATSPPLTPTGQGTKRDYSKSFGETQDARKIRVDREATSLASSTSSTDAFSLLNGVSKLPTSRETISTVKSTEVNYTPSIAVSLPLCDSRTSPPMAPALLATQPGRPILHFPPRVGFDKSQSNLSTTAQNLTSAMLNYTLKSQPASKPAVVAATPTEEFGHGFPLEGNHLSRLLGASGTPSLDEPSDTSVTSDGNSSSDNETADSVTQGQLEYTSTSRPAWLREEQKTSAAFALVQFASAC